MILKWLAGNETPLPISKKEKRSYRTLVCALTLFFLSFLFAQINLKLCESRFICGENEKTAPLEIPRLATLAEHGERASGFTATDANDITARGDKTQGE